MKLEIKDSANYAAQIIRIPEPFKLPNSDRLYGITVLGYTVVGDASWLNQVGELAVFFPAESQLAAWYVEENDLYRHSDLNRDPSKSGYIEDSRRVKAIKLRGTVSNGLIMPISSLGNGQSVQLWRDLKEGDTFDTIDGVEICRKYRIKEPQVYDRTGAKIKQAFKRVDSTLMPEHIETDQYYRNEGLLSDDDVLIVTQKLHGTSARFANTLVRRQLKWYERLAVRLGIPVADTEYDTVAGSRHSIKDPHNPAQQHFYGEGGDIWTDYLAKIESAIPKGYIIYGEIVGWLADGRPIQKGHTYGEVKGDSKLYVYRVSVVNPDGVIADLHWDAVRQFCASRGIATVPELVRTFKRDFEPKAFEEKAFRAEWGKGINYTDAPAPISDGGTGRDEGIAIRVERGGPVPMLFKIKNDSHFLYETAQLDSGEPDIESEN